MFGDKNELLGMIWALIEKIIDAIKSMIGGGDGNKPNDDESTVKA